MTPAAVSRIQLFRVIVPMLVIFIIQQHLPFPQFVPINDTLSFLISLQSSRNVELCVIAILRPRQSTYVQPGNHIIPPKDQRHSIMDIRQ
jgi:hypothetical protein